jgi:transcription initiation factor TFIIB
MLLKSRQQPFVCPECGSLEVIKDPEIGEISCAHCGLVIRETMIDRGPEWRAFTLEEKQKLRRTGPPTIYRSYDKMLSTTFRPYRDALGKRLPLKTRRRMFRLRRLNLRSRLYDSSIRNLLKATSEIRRISEKLNLPYALQEIAANIYRRALSKGLIRGRSIDSIAAASLYAACRMTKTPRRLREVVMVSGRERKEITRCYRLIVRSLGLKMPIDGPIKFVSKIRCKTGASQAVENRAVVILREAEQKGILMGKDPVGVAAATLYIAARIAAEKISQRKIAKAAGVTEVTIRNRYKDLIKGLDLHLDRKMNSREKAR